MYLVPLFFFKKEINGFFDSSFFLKSFRMNPDLAKIEPAGGSWFYGALTSQGHTAVMVAVTEKGEVYNYGLKSKKEGYRWRCLPCKDFNGYGWCGATGIITHEKECKELQSEQQHSFKDFVRQWAALMVVYHVVNITFTEDSIPAIFRRWLATHGTNGFNEWKELLRRMGLPDEDEASWKNIHPFLEAMMRKKIKKRAYFDQLVSTFYVRMASIRTVNVEGALELEKAARNLTVPITHELTLHEELICDLDEMLMKSDEVALKIEQDWTRTIEVYEAQIKFAREEMARLKRRQKSERRGLERQRAKAERDIQDIQEMVGRIDEPVSPPAKRRRRHRGPVSGEMSGLAQDGGEYSGGQNPPETIQQNPEMLLEREQESSEHAELEFQQSESAELDFQQSESEDQSGEDVSQVEDSSEHSETETQQSGCEDRPDGYVSPVEEDSEYVESEFQQSDHEDRSGGEDVPLEDDSEHSKMETQKSGCYERPNGYVSPVEEDSEHVESEFQQLEQEDRSGGDAVVVEENLEQSEIAFQQPGLKDRPDGGPKQSGDVGQDP